MAEPDEAKESVTGLTSGDKEPKEPIGATGTGLIPLLELVEATELTEAKLVIGVKEPNEGKTVELTAPIEGKANDNIELFAKLSVPLTKESTAGLTKGLKEPKEPIGATGTGVEPAALAEKPVRPVATAETAATNNNFFIFSFPKNNVTYVTLQYRNKNVNQTILLSKIINKHGI